MRVMASGSTPAMLGAVLLGSVARAPAAERHRYEVFMNEPWPAGCRTACHSGPCKHWVDGIPDWTKWGILANPNSTDDGPVVVTQFGKDGVGGKVPRFQGQTAGNWNASNATAVFGGLPQLMDMKAHLAQLEVDIVAILPDADSSGVATLDWEAWKPNFRDNGWEEYWIYINRSIALVQQQHPGWPPEMQVAQAETDFNHASQTLWNSTIKLCRKLRPKTTWGWYNFPGEANGSPANPGPDDRMMWIYENVDALFPSTNSEIRQP